MNHAEHCRKCLKRFASEFGLCVKCGNLHINRSNQWNNGISQPIAVKAGDSWWTRPDVQRSRDVFGSQLSAQVERMKTSRFGNVARPITESAE